MCDGIKTTQAKRPSARMIAGALLWAGASLLPLHAAELSIADGVTVKFGQDAGIVVRDSLRTGEHVTFTSVKDDTVAGQTGATAQTPAAGDWQGIKLEASVSAPSLVLEGSTIKYSIIGLDLRKLSPSINFLTVSDSLTGIRATATAAPLFDGLSLANNFTGMEVDGNSTPSIGASFIQGNSALGVSNLTPSALVQAPNNWWGAASGPSDPAGNPAGTGDAVSVGVNYTPWLTEIPLINPQLRVAGGLTFTNVPQITLLLSCGNAVEYRIAEGGNFTGVAFAPMLASTPFTLSAGDGVKQLSVQYRTATGNIATAALAQGILFDALGPSLSITNPAEASFITGSITISATASDAAGLAKVEFFIDDALMTTLVAAPFEFLWDVTTVADGPHTIRVVAHDTVGHTSAATRSVTLTKAAPPPPDTSGPNLTNLTLAALAVIEGGTITNSGTLSVSASDPSGISRIEFLLDGALFALDSDGSNGYTGFLDVRAVADGPHVLTLRAFDSLNNTSESTFNIVVALAAPAAPAITNPATGFVTNQTQVSVSGTAEAQSQVVIHNNGTAVTAAVTADSAGRFSALAPLVPGANSVQAVASNRGGSSALSTAVVITVDASIPASPTGLTASAQPAGTIRLAWNRSLDSQVAGYNLYRSTLAFNATSEASKVNGAVIPAATTSLDNLPTVDGTYFYRLVAVNGLGTASIPSNQASAASDSALPKATEIVYAPLGAVDPTTGRIAAGRVNVTVKVSEALLAAPFLSIAPQNGVPLAVTLTKTTDTDYAGFFDITPTTPSGTAFAVFSARDRVGNRGTDVLAGASITIDAQGPSLTAIALTPVSPIKNDAAAPASVAVAITLSEAIKAAEAPQLKYVLSSDPLTEIAITGLTQSGALTWNGSFTLATGAGATQVETLRFAYSGRDDLDNVSTTIAADNQFQVYQGELPPLETPREFAGTAQPQGKVALTWRAVDAAAGYQIYRQAPGELALTAHQRVVSAVEFTDTPTVDGLYRYAIASVRGANGQEALSPLSAPPIEISADAQAPGAPQNLLLALIGQGIQATWDAPLDGTAAAYRLYRASGTAITATAGLTPIKDNIRQLIAIDATPTLGEHAYAVTAVDAAGNESAVSNTAVLNFALVPVSSLSVRQVDANLPQVSWTHPTPAAIAGYDLYLGPDATRAKLNAAPILITNFTDTGYAGDERRYTVVAFDVNGVEIARAITLPKLSAQLVAGTPIKRGVMNRLQYQVTNASSAAVNNARIKTQIGPHASTTTAFSVAAGETKLVPVVIGGFADIANLASLATTLEITPNEGERVQIVRNQNIDALDGALVLKVATVDFTRGASGTATFTLENTSEVETEILVATATGKSPSTELRYKLVDPDNNVLATQSILQVLGSNVITLANGNTVARIPPGASFTSNEVAIGVPSSAPNNIAVQLDIDKLHYHLGQEDAVTLTGLTGRQNTVLIDTPYVGETTSITPASVQPGQDVVIQGRAVDRLSALALPNVPLRLVFNVRGFEREFNVFTDAAGAFTHTFTPTATEGGVYKVSTVHPDIFERPVQGEFVVNSVTLQFATFKLNNPRNFPFTINVRATAGDGTTATNLRFVYEAADQPSGAFIPGLTVTPGAPIALTSRQSATLALTVAGDNTAPEFGSFLVKAFSDESGLTPVGTLRVDYRLTDAVPALFATPSFVETGLAQGQSVTEQVTLENRGFAEATNVTATLLSADGSPAPSWIYLMSPGELGTVPVGASRLIDIAATPPTSLAEGIYTFTLRVAAANATGGDVPVYVSITQSGIGNALFKVSDIFTATLDQAGNRIPGLQGARITVQNEQVLSVTHTLTTDSFGEAFFSDLPAGRYKFQATAVNHQQVIGRFTVKPGVTATQDVFLDFNLVTVEWSVREITIQDKYEIVLTAVFETDVPAAVVVVEPTGVTLPSMQAGDVFYGELTLTNYGLVRAENLSHQLPASDSFIRYEFLTAVPAALEAKQRLTIPYRAVALLSFDPSGTASGGGCFSYSNGTRFTYDYECANGTRTGGNTGTTWSFFGGACGGTAAGGPTGGGGGGGGGAGGFLGGTAPSFSPLPGAACRPDTPCPDGTCCVGGGAGGGNGGGPQGF